MCPKRMRLYFISSRRVAKTGNLRSPMFGSMTWSLFSVLFLSKQSRSHLFWSHVLPCSAMYEFKSFATTGRSASIAGGSCLLLASSACLSASSFPVMLQCDGIQHKVILF